MEKEEQAGAGRFAGQRFRQHHPESERARLYGDGAELHRRLFEEKEHHGDDRRGGGAAGGGHGDPPEVSPATGRRRCTRRVTMPHGEMSAVPPVPMEVMAGGAAVFVLSLDDIRKF